MIQMVQTNEASALRPVLATAMVTHFTSGIGELTTKKKVNM